MNSEFYATFEDSLKAEFNGVSVDKMFHPFSSNCHSKPPVEIIESWGDYCQLKKGHTGPHWKYKEKTKLRGLWYTESDQL